MADTPTHQTSTNRRRQYYIKPSFQRRFILQFSGLLLIGCVAFGLSLYAYSSFAKTLTTAFVHSRLRVMSTADFLLPALGLLTLVVAGTLTLTAAIRFLFFSHQLAGPLYRLEKTAKTIGNGDLRLHVRLREGDEFQEFASSLDGMVTELRTQVQEIKEQTQRLRTLIQQASQSYVMPPDFMRELQATQDRLDEAIGRFRV